jgi:hypothetical protein
MDKVDEKDRILHAKGIPQSSVGAPLSLIVANEQRVVLAYYAESIDPSWDLGMAFRDS